MEPETLHFYKGAILFVEFLRIVYGEEDRTAQEAADRLKDFLRLPAEYIEALQNNKGR